MIKYIFKKVEIVYNNIKTKICKICNVIVSSLRFLKRLIDTNSASTQNNANIPLKIGILGAGIGGEF
jgi:hypothetical protein